MSSSEEYWKKRAEERESEWTKKSKTEIEQEIKKLYTRALINIKKDINDLYEKFADENGLSMAEAKKLITGNEYTVWRMDIEDYVQKSELNNKLLKELNTLAMKSRIGRLDKLYGEILLELTKMAEGYDDKLTDYLKTSLTDNYYHTTFDICKGLNILLPVSTLDTETVEDIIKTPWSGKQFSKRIWNNTDTLAKVLKQEISNAMIRGVNSREMAQVISKKMDSSYKQAMTLVRSELNYVNNQSSLKSIKDAGGKKYRFIATLDSKTSMICRQLDGTIHEVDKGVPGTNMPPMHPRCRSTIAITNLTSSSARKRISRVGGEIRYVPADMKYTDWEKVYVKKTMTLEEWEKANKKSKAKKNDIIKTKERLYNATIKLKATMQDNDYQKYIDIVAKNKDINYLYINYADKVKNITYTANNGTYSPKNNTLKYSFERTPGMNKFSILAHEYGHFFDNNVAFKNLRFQEIEKINEIIKTVLPNYTYLVNRASYSDEFLSALRLDKEHIKTIFNIEIRTRLKNDHASAGVQDAIDGLFVNSRIAWGHGESYYNRKYNDIKKLKLHSKLKEAYTSLGFTANNQSKVKVLCRIYDAASEAWANIMSAVTTGGKELEYIREFLPNSYNKFLEIIQGVNEDDG